MVQRKCKGRLGKCYMLRETLKHFNKEQKFTKLPRLVLNFGFSCLSFLNIVITCVPPHPDLLYSFDKSTECSVEVRPRVL